METKKVYIGTPVLTCHPCGLCVSTRLGRPEEGESRPKMTSSEDGPDPGDAGVVAEGRKRSSETVTEGRTWKVPATLLRTRGIWRVGGTGGGRIGAGCSSERVE